MNLLRTKSIGSKTCPGLALAIARRGFAKGGGLLDSRTALRFSDLV
jgi:hypothetical protein